MRFPRRNFLRSWLAEKKGLVGYLQVVLLPTAERGVAGRNAIFFFPTCRRVGIEATKIRPRREATVAVANPANPPQILPLALSRRQPAKNNHRFHRWQSCARLPLRPCLLASCSSPVSGTPTERWGRRACLLSMRAWGLFEWSAVARAWWRTGQDDGVGIFFFFAGFGSCRALLPVAPPPCLEFSLAGGVHGMTVVALVWPGRHLEARWSRETVPNQTL